MGPITVFDKSFLQSLSLDESVWFDQYFTTVITPLFFIETLADLEKQAREGRTPEDEVGGIASKTPELSGSPTMFHVTLCNGELRGYPVPMTGRPVLGGAKRAVVGAKRGMVIELSPEAQALERWRRREFMEVERGHAKAWREMLAAPVANAGNDFLSQGFESVKACKSLPEVLKLARSITDGQVSPYERMKFVFEVVPVQRDRDRIYAYYKAVGAPPFRTFAPYTAHVLDVEIFCRLAMKKGLISAERPSNRVDVSYLNYLPFCKVFVSGDRLHRATVPLFIDSTQDFVWGPDLKADLKRINELHASVPDEVREKGIFAFAPRPPYDGDFLTSRLWDRMNDQWRTPMMLNLDNPKLHAYAIDMLKKMRASANNGVTKPMFNLDAVDSLIIDRKVREKKGNWYQMPKGLGS